MKLAIIKESTAGESRVAATPATIKKMVAAGLSVIVEKGAGVSASILDDHYKEAGATLAKDAATALKDADIVMKVQRPLRDKGDGGADELAMMKKGAILISALNPAGDADGLKAYAKQGVTAVAMELMPRITRAQSMDILSSQANLAGYKAVLDAAHDYGRAFPMMMTAAGTVAPARVFVMGAGVAGLQAIATAKRLGAIVSATDVRMAAKEQVESLGGKFVMVEDEETAAAETAGGYAKEMSDAYKAKQAALIAETIPKQDIIITTALIPGRPAPRLVTAEMVKSMKPGSVIMDMAAPQGGNVEGCVPGETVEVGGVKILGPLNLPSRLAADTSELYAKNLLTFLQLILSEEGTINWDWEDDIIKATVLTHDGKIVHEGYQ